MFFRLKEIKKRGIDSAGLRWIALFCMVLDHIGLVIFEYGLYYQGGAEVFGQIAETPVGPLLPLAAKVLRMIGRLSFPLYCFLLVEGFLHTRNWKKYWLRLIALAFVSEIPFDLAVFHCWWNGGYQNVFFELAAGLLVLKGLETAELQGPVRGAFLSLAVAGAGAAFAWYLRADYHVIGILYITLFYCTRSSQKRQAAWGGALGFWQSLPGQYGAGILCLFPILLYNGKPGSRRGRSFFYWFYPAHLLILAAVRQILFEMGS